MNTATATHRTPPAWPEGYDPMRGAEAEALVAALAAAGFVINAEGEGASLRAADHAIQSAVEYWCSANGVSQLDGMPDFDYGSPRWYEILPNALAHLGVDEVALEVL